MTYFIWPLHAMPGTLAAVFFSCHLFPQEASAMRTLKLLIPCLVVCAATILATVPERASAADLRQCLSQTVGCGSQIAKTTLDVLDTAGTVLAFSAQHPNCVADIVAGNAVTIGISTAMAGLAGSGVLKQEGGSYLKYVYGPGARPVIQAINGVVPVPPLQALLTSYGDDALGAAFSAATSAIPMPSVGAPTLDMQLRCGDAIAAAGADMIGKIKNVIGNAKAAVQTCSAAAACFAAVLQDIVKDPVGAVGGAVVAVGRAVNNTAEKAFQDDHMTWQQYFDQNWAPGGSAPGSRIDGVAKGIAAGDPQAWNSYAKWIYDNCYGYFNGHRLSSDNAKGVCNDMRDGTATHIGEFAGRGATQLVQWRTQEYFLPAAIKAAASAAVKAYATPVNRDLGPPPPDLAKFWPKNPSDYWLGEAVRAAYGLKGSEIQVDQWGFNNVGATAQGIARSRQPDPGNSRQGAENAVAQAEQVFSTQGSASVQGLIDAAKAQERQRLIAKAQAEKSQYAVDNAELLTLQALCTKAGTLVTQAKREACLAGVKERYELCTSPAAGAIPQGNGSAMAAAIKANAEANKALEANRPACIEEIRKWVSATMSAPVVSVKGGASPTVLVPSAVGGGATGGSAAMAAPGGLAVAGNGVPVSVPEAAPAPRRLGMPSLPTMGAIRAPLVPPVVAAVPTSPVPAPVAVVPPALPAPVAPPVQGPIVTSPAVVPSTPQVVAIVPPALAAGGRPLAIPQGGVPQISPPVVPQAPAVAMPVPPSTSLPPARTPLPVPGTARPTLPAVPTPAPVARPPVASIVPAPAPSTALVVPQATPVIKPMVVPAPVAAPMTAPVAAPLRLPAAVAVPEFDRAAYVRARLGTLQAAWAARCQSNATCLQLINRAAAQRADEEAAALAGNPATASSPANVARVQASLDSQYDALVRSAWEQAVQAATPVPAPITSSSKIEPPKVPVRPPAIRIPGGR